MLRDDICKALARQLEPCEDVLALWLEGADALNKVDEYSDLDICVSVTPGTMDSAETAVRDVITHFGELDHDVVEQQGPDRRHIVLHLADTLVHALIDIDIVVDCGSNFYPDDPIEAPKILFDKANIIKFDVAELGKGELLEALASFDNVINE
ncbi:MAG: hypothetical protein AAF512_11790, partial [Pseudomonadota bacterium]